MISQHQVFTVYFPMGSVAACTQVIEQLPLETKDLKLTKHKKSPSLYEAEDYAFCSWLYRL